MLFKNLSLKSIGKTDCVENFIHPEKIANYYEMLLVTNGTVHLCENYNRYSVSRGQLIILDKEKSYYGYCESSDPVSAYWIYFDAEPVGKCEVKLLDCGNESDMLCSLVKRINDMYWSFAYPDEAFDTMLSVLFNEIYRIFLSSQKGDYSAPLNEICQWICDNCSENIKATDVAKKFSYNEDYLTRLFKSYYHMGIKNYIDKAKLLYIKRLLQDKDISLAKMPDLCGFLTYRSFLMFFSYHENMTPTQYRKMCFVIK